MSIGFGARARVGHLYPSGGLCDYELQLMAPEGVQFLVTRLPFRAAGVADDLALLADLETHCGLLADAGVQLIAMNCTAAAMLAGPETVNERISAATGIAAVNTAEAVLAGLRAAGVRRPALLTPYPREVVAAECELLAERGVQVAQTLGRPCPGPIEQASIPPADWVEMAAGVDRERVDGLLISCAGIQLAGVVEVIERELGLPVVASNPALLRLVLRRLGIAERPQRHGALLAGAFDA